MTLSDSPKHSSLSMLFISVKEMSTYLARLFGGRGAGLRLLLGFGFRANLPRCLGFLQRVLLLS